MSLSTSRPLSASQQDAHDRYNLTTSLGWIAKICPCKIAGLRSLATRVSGFLDAPNSLGLKTCAYKCRCRAIHLSLEPGEAPVCVSNCHSSSLTPVCRYLPSLPALDESARSCQPRVLRLETSVALDRKLRRSYPPWHTEERHARGHAAHETR